FVLNSIRNFSVQAEGFDIIDTFNQPGIQGKIVRDVFNHARIELCFCYEKWMITDAYDPRNYYVHYVNIENKPTYTRVHRDMAFEKKCTHLLTENGLVYENGVWKLTTYNSDGYYEMLQWIQNNKTTLDSIGLIIFDESTEKQVQNLEARID